MIEAPVLFGLSALIAHLIEKAKRSPSLSWVDAHADGVTKLLTTLASIVTALGVSYTFDSTAGELIIRGIPTSVDQAVSVVLHAFGQYWMSKAYYLAAIKPRMEAAVKPITIEVTGMPAPPDPPKRPRRRAA